MATFSDSLVTSTALRSPCPHSLSLPSSLLDDLSFDDDGEDNSMKEGEENRRNLEYTEELLSEFTKGKESSSSNGNQQQDQQLQALQKKRHSLIQDVKQKIRSNHPDTLKDAKRMVRRIVALEKQQDVVSEGDSLTVVLRAYNLWMHALARCAPEDEAGKRAENVLEEMIQQGVRPNVVTYTSIIDAHAKSGTPEKVQPALEKALLLLEGDSNKSSSITSSITIDAILNAWAQQGTMKSAEQAELILLRLETAAREQNQNVVRPTANSYATVIKAWGNVGTWGAAERAELLLNRMIKQYQIGNNGSLRDFVVEPNVSVFHKAIIAWANCDHPESGERAWKLVQQMKTLAEQQPPDGTLVYNTYPDIVTYNAAITAISHNTNDANAGPKTERLVQEMQKAVAIAEEEMKDNSNNTTAILPPSPNTVTYNNILYAWSKSSLPGAAARAEAILKYMLNSGRQDIFPDAISFNSVLDAFAKTKEIPHKARKARELLDQMLELSCDKAYYRSLRPTSAIPFNAVLNACAFSAIGTTQEEQREELQIAVTTYKTMSSSSSNGSTGVYPDTVTYGNMLKCFANLMPRGATRSKMSLQVFQKCCNEGLVGPLVWKEVKRAVPYKVLEDVLSLRKPVTKVQLKDLPRHWKNRNRFDKQNKREIKDPNSDVRERQANQRTMYRGPSLIETAAESGRDL